MNPFTHSGTRRPTVAILPMPATPLSARALLLPMFAFGFLSGMTVMLIAAAVWP